MRWDRAAWAAASRLIRELAVDRISCPHAGILTRDSCFISPVAVYQRDQDRTSCHVVNDRCTYGVKATVCSTRVLCGSKPYRECVCRGASHSVSVGETQQNKQTSVPPCGEHTALEKRDGEARRAEPVRGPRLRVLWSVHFQAPALSRFSYRRPPAHHDLPRSPAGVDGTFSTFSSLDIPTCPLYTLPRVSALPLAERPSASLATPPAPDRLVHRHTVDC